MVEKALNENSQGGHVMSRHVPLSRTCRSSSKPTTPRSCVLSKRRHVPSSRSRGEIGGNATAGDLPIPLPTKSRFGGDEDEDDDDDEQDDRCNAAFTPARMAARAFLTIGGSRTWAGGVPATRTGSTWGGGQSTSC